MPERPAPDPFSLALGRIEGRLEGIEKRLDDMVTRAELLGLRGEFGAALRGLRGELRAYATVILLALGALFAAVLRHGG